MICVASQIIFSPWMRTGTSPDAFKRINHGSLCSLRGRFTSCSSHVSAFSAMARRTWTDRTRFSRWECSAHSRTLRTAQLRSAGRLLLCTPGPALCPARPQRAPRTPPQIRTSAPVPSAHPARGLQAAPPRSRPSGEVQRDAAHPRAPHRRGSGSPEPPPRRPHLLRGEGLRPVVQHQRRRRPAGPRHTRPLLREPARRDALRGGRPARALSGDAAVLCGTRGTAGGRPCLRGSRPQNRLRHSLGVVREDGCAGGKVTWPLKKSRRGGRLFAFLEQGF